MVAGNATEMWNEVFVVKHLHLGSKRGGSGEVSVGKWEHTM